VIVQLFDDVAARNSTAVQAYRDIQAKALYTRQATSQFASADTPGVDVIVVPTMPEHPTIKAMLDDPIRLNSKLGSFTHFGNILDLCAVASPAGTYEEKTVIGEGETKVTLPFSITFLGARCTDAEVLRVAGQFAEAVS
jgi:Asp-tRNA(Asn)/Glu-tRNA(Gln) amidotransferase A subunit family amidase